MANLVLPEVTEPWEGIYEFVEPQNVDSDEWMATHTDCSTIIDNHGDRMTVYAFTREPAYNRTLARYRREHLADHKILIGIPSNVLSGII